MKSLIKGGLSSLVFRFGVCIGITSFCIPTQAADWPNWRGPSHNGISTEKGWDPGRIKAGVKPLWRASVGIGFSTVSVSDGLVYAMGNTGTKSKDASQHKDIIYCFDAETGKEIWKYAYPQQLDPKYYEGGTLASPTVSNGKVYTISKDGKAFCLDAKTGKEIWHKNFLEDLGYKRTTWGFSGSPLIIDTMVIYNVGAKGVALDRNDGNVIWENGKDPGGYATAVPFMIGQQQCIALFGSRDIIVLVASTGKELWRFPWPTKYDVNASDPIIVDGKVFISSGYGTGCALLRLEGEVITEIWRNKNMRNKMNGSVLWEGNIYGVDEGGELRCLDFETGQPVWTQGGFGLGSLMIADGKLIVMAENGNLVIAEAIPDGYKVISEAHILSPRCWTVPVLANGRIYVRNAGGDLVCLDVSNNTQTTSARSNWAQWHGPNRDATSTEKRLLKQWPPSGPRLLWSANGLGTGFSTVSIADGLIYTTGMIDGKGILFAFDLQGNRKWHKPYGPEWTKDRPGARGTPTVDQDHVYLISGMGVVACFDAKTGEKKWIVDAFNKFKGKYGPWGIAESPLIVEDLVICTPGGEAATMVALDKKTGRTVWASKSIGERSSYCSPILVKRGNRNLIVTMTDHSIIGVDVEDGNILWQYDCKLYQGKPKAINPNTPIYHDRYIYVSSGYGKGGAKLKLSEDGSEVVAQEWANLTLDCQHGGVVLVDGYIYGSNMKGNWVCLNWDSGEVTYETKGIGKGSVTYADGMLYCYGETEGRVALVKPSPQEFTIASSFKITRGTGQHWAHPVICNGRLYIRHGNALMAYDIRANPSLLVVPNIDASASDAHPNFSEDDSHLVYMSDGEIKTVEIASGKVTNLTNSPTADLCPDWSNDGRTIVFDSKREDVNRDLYVMAVNGTNVQRLTNEPSQQDKCPAFSADDSRITYICTANGDMDIFVMNSDGSGVKNLTNDPGSDRCPSWTPDGKKITFMSNRTGFFEVYIMNSDDGSNLEQLTDLKIKGSNCWVAAVSPDGKQVCFVGDHEGNNDLYVMDIDGKNVRNLTQHKASDQWPAWSHDGEWIAFASTRSGKERLYVIHPEGAGLRPVTGLENNQILE